MKRPSSRISDRTTIERRDSISGKTHIPSPLPSHPRADPLPDLLLVIPQNHLLLLLAPALQLPELLVGDPAREEGQVRGVTPERELEVGVEQLLESLGCGGQGESRAGEL